MAFGLFENDVIFNGSQTTWLEKWQASKFENDVIFNGSQTEIKKTVPDG